MVLKGSKGWVILMSKYTTEVRFICENYAGKQESVDGMEVNDVIALALPKIFDFDFPIYDESYRNVLETKIIKHYYTREIGLETVGLWKLKLETKMNEIMPFYNNLYKVAGVEFNPFGNVDITTRRLSEDEGNRNELGKNTGTETTDSAGTNNITETTDNRTTINNTNNHNYQDNINDFDNYSDTPQGGLTGVSQLRYLTNARNINGDHRGDSTTTDSGTNVMDGSRVSDGSSSDHSTVTRNLQNDFDSNYTDTRKYVEHVMGKNGGLSYVELIDKYADVLGGVDMMVINSLGELFMNLW